MNARDHKSTSLNRWTIGRKLATAFAAVAGITLLLGIVGYHGALTSGASISEIGLRNFPSVQSLQNLSIAMKNIDVAEEEIISPFAPASVREESHAVFVSAKKEAEAQARIFENLPHSAQELAAWEDFRGKWNKWWKAHENYVQAERQMVAFDVANCNAIQRDMANFQRDHLRLKLDLRDLIESGKPVTNSIDHSKCEFTRWAAGFNSTNRVIADLMESARTLHKKSHEIGTQVVIMNSRGEKQAATELLRSDFDQVTGKTLDEFGKISAQLEGGNQLIEAMNKSMDLLDTDAQAATDALASLVSYYSKSSLDSSSASVERARLLKKVSLGAMIAGVTIAVIFGFFITRDINQILRQIASSLHSGARQTSAAAEDVSSASRSLAEGASGQAASLEETSASIEELSSMTRRNAESAKSARKLASEARLAAESGSENNRRMDEVVKSIEEATLEMRSTMDTARDANNKVSKIIRTIDEIAFQTNILALNAAVEAARAGEAGKGFAVVADEVRALALKSAAAARETALNIESALGETEAGVRASEKVSERLKMVIDETGLMDRSLADIVTKAREVDSLVAQIAAASEEQSQGIAQLNSAVSEIDKVTQANAAHAEESAGSAQQLNLQAMTLNVTVEDLLHLVDHHHVVSAVPASGIKASPEDAFAKGPNTGSSLPETEVSWATSKGSKRSAVPLILEHGRAS